MCEEFLETINTFVGLGLTCAGIFIAAPGAFKHWRNRWPDRRLSQLVDQVADQLRRIRTSVGMIEPLDDAGTFALVAQGSAMAPPPVVTVQTDVEWLTKRLNDMDEQRQVQALQLQENLDGIIRDLADQGAESVIRDGRGIPIALLGAILSGAPAQLAVVPWLSGILSTVGLIWTARVAAQNVSAWTRFRARLARP